MISSFGRVGSFVVGGQTDEGGFFFVKNINRAIIWDGQVWQTSLWLIWA